jgi:transposase
MQSNGVHDRVRQAGIDYLADPDLNIRDAAKRYDISKSALSAHLRRDQSTHSERHPNARLSIAQEKVLCLHILALQQQYRAVHYVELRVLANILAQQNADPEKPFQPIGIN